MDNVILFGIGMFLFLAGLSVCVAIVEFPEPYAIGIGTGCLATVIVFYLLGEEQEKYRKEVHGEPHG